MSSVKNLNLSIGLYEKALPDNLDWEEKLILARDAGYNFMELSIDETDERIGRLKWDMQKKRKLRNITEKIGIPLLTMCLSGNRRFPIGSSFSDVQKRGVEIIIEAIYFASHLGIRIIQIAGYNVVNGEKSTSLSKEAFGRNLKKCLNLASSLGVMIALENVDCEFADSLDKIIPYVKDINSPWLQLYPDFGNLTAMKQDVERQLKAYAGHIAAIHVKDTREGIVRNVPFGEGAVNFISAFRILKSVGFNGPFLLEMWADDNKDNYKIIKSSMDWIIEKLMQSSYLMTEEYHLVTH
ncbi:MAG: L-ribulose-5-phosphate 3-epimerase [Actinobacteria bacterium]|nr:L-ribulose-5-phosphate 3-epimerase [Actinomycetota bacterium]